jgi:hypothetical protein
MPQGPWHLITHVLEIGKEYAWVGMGIGVFVSWNLASDPAAQVSGAVVAGYFGAVLGALARIAFGPRE